VPCRGLKAKKKSRNYPWKQRKSPFRTHWWKRWKQERAAAAISKSNQRQSSMTRNLLGPKNLPKNMFLLLQLSLILSLSGFCPKNCLLSRWWKCGPQSKTASWTRPLTCRRNWPRPPRMRPSPRSNLGRTGNSRRARKALRMRTFSGTWTAWRR